MHFHTLHLQSSPRVVFHHAPLFTYLLSLSFDIVFLLVFLYHYPYMCHVCVMSSSSMSHTNIFLSHCSFRYDFFCYYIFLLPSSFPPCHPPSLPASPPSLPPSPPLILVRNKQRWERRTDTWERRRRRINLKNSIFAVGWEEEKWKWGLQRGGKNNSEGWGCGCEGEEERRSRVKISIKRIYEEVITKVWRG